MIMIICATGRSVNKMDWPALTKYKTLGVNQFFRKEIPTDYYYIYDKMCIHREHPNFTSVMGKWPDTIFYIDKQVPLDQKANHNPNIVRTTSQSVLKEDIGDYSKWAKNLDEPLYINKSTVTGAINIAHILGATEIYVAGLDGNGGYFYPHKHNRYRNRLHDSLNHYPEYGTLTKSIKQIIKWLQDKNVGIYNMNAKSFFVVHGVMTFKMPG